MYLITRFHYNKDWNSNYKKEKKELLGLITRFHYILYPYVYVEKNRKAL